jgi:stress-induced morphogen
VGPLSSAEISLAISGFQQMTSEDSYVPQVLEALFANQLPNQRWSSREICQALGGLKSMKATTGEMKRLLGFLSAEMKFIRNLKTKMTKKSIRNSSASSQLRGEGDTVYTLEMIVEAFAGLRSMSSSGHEVQTITEYLREELEQHLSALCCSNSLPQHAQALSTIGLIVGSMSNMCSHHDTVRLLLKTLALSLPKIHPDAALAMNSPTLTRTDEWLTDLIYGLKLMDSDHYEVRSLVRGLIPHLSATLTCIDPSPVSVPLTFKPFHVVKMLSGLRGSSNDAFSGISLADGSGVGGRGGHVNRGEPVCDILKICLSAIERCAEPISLSRVCGAFYGLQNMQSGPVGHPSCAQEVVALIDSLVAKLPTEQEQEQQSRVSVRDCCHGLYGLLGIADEASVSVLVMKLSLVNTLIALTKASSASLTADDRVEVERILCFYSHRPLWLTSPEITLQFQTLQEALHQTRHQQRALRVVSESAITPPLPPSKGRISELEASFYQDVTQLFGMELYLLGCSTSSPPTDPLAPLIRRLRTTTSPSLHFKTRQNETLLGFESDFLLRIYRQGEAQEGGAPVVSELVGVVNIEIDGPSHMPRHKRRFAALRDQYLRRVYQEKTPGLFFQIYRLHIPDTRGDFSRQKRKSLLSESAFQDLVRELEDRELLLPPSDTVVVQPVVSEEKKRGRGTGKRALR